MDYASADLRNEHEGILHGLKILERMTDRLDAGTAIAREELLGMVDFLRLFADKCHHGKEEGLYFPALESHGIKNSGGPIGQMLVEHVEGRAFIAGMASALGPVDLDVPGFSKNARGYISLLRSHIAKENEVLFAMGDRVLPEELQKELLERFEEHEERVMGAGTHEKLHAMLKEFAAKYPG